MTMFERYSEKARQTIVRAKHEADRFGSREIVVEHILLALLNDAILISGAANGVSEKRVREIITARLPRGETLPFPHDLPLSGESRQALILAAEEAEGLGHQHIGNEHLLLALMRRGNSYAAELLKQEGLSTDKLRAQIAGPES
jgi:ATP-dependent Clp protease ATP-binding subunit ClpA